MVKQYGRKNIQPEDSMNCKICRIPLRDDSYYLDIYGTKSKKEEIVCPFDDQHEEIIEKRLKEFPTRCPICDSKSNIETEHRIFKNQKGIITIAIDLICSCNFCWSIIGKGDVIYDEEQLNEYGEYE